MVKCRYCDDGKEFSYSVEFLEHEKECRESQGKNNSWKHGRNQSTIR